MFIVIPQMFYITFIRKVNFNLPCRTCVGILFQAAIAGVFESGFNSVLLGCMMLFIVAILIPVTALFHYVQKLQAIEH